MLLLFKLNMRNNKILTILSIIGLSLLLILCSYVKIILFEKELEKTNMLQKILLIEVIHNTTTFVENGQTIQQKQITDDIISDRWLFYLVDISIICFSVVIAGLIVSQNHKKITKQFDLKIKSEQQTE